MATIKSAISLTDLMSAPLNNIMGAIQGVTSAWGGLESATSNGVAVDGMEEIQESAEDVCDSVEDAARKQEEFNNKIKQGMQNADALGAKLKSLAAVAGIGALAKSAIEFASDLTEVQNVVDVSFGDMSSSVDEWATGTLAQFGLNELSAKQFAGTMGAMLKSSGLAGDAVSDMAMKITEMSGDMASFYNLGAEEAFNKIRSGISGETEPLKQLGINMSVANLEAFALSQGLEKQYDQMTQAEQVTLRYNYLLQATADAQGDFARTQKSFSNQTKLLQENFKAFTGDLATLVLPILASGIELLNSGLTFMRDNLEIVVPIIGAAVAILGAYAAVHFALGAAQTFATVKQWALNNAVFSCPVFWIIAAIIALIAIVIALANHFSGAGHTAQTAFGAVMGVVFGIGATIKNVGLTIANVAIGIWNWLGALCTNIGVAFHNVISSVQGWWYSLLSTVLNVVAGICEALNKIPFIEFDYGGVVNAANEYAQKSAEAYGDKQDYTSMTAAFDKGNNTFDTFEDGWWNDAYASGAQWGDAASEKIGGFLDDAGVTGENGIFGGAGGGAMGDIAANTGSTAGSAKDISKSLDVADEDLKYLRDIAEKEAINRFTTAEVRVDLGGVTQNVSSGTDLDGLIDYLTGGMKVALASAANGVHY